MVARDTGQIIAQLEAFRGEDLTLTLAEIEKAARGTTSADCRALLRQAHAESSTLLAAADMKRLSGQIDVVIHALGILLCLPHLLEEGERVDYLSLGAGNTGRDFDLETNLRVAEFKFINWRGGSESVRQNSIFKDFFLLAESETNKQRYLYVLGTQYPLKFFNGRRALDSVLSKDHAIRQKFYAFIR